MLRSRGISQICHTYLEDMHPVYPSLPWLHTPQLRLRVTTVAEGAYPPLRCGMSYYTLDAMAVLVMIYNYTDF